MTIIMKTTALSRAAVEKFSTKISGIIVAPTMRMYLKACLSAPFSVCIALRICAVARIMVPFASSDGWNWKPKRGIHLCAPFVA